MTLFLSLALFSTFVRWLGIFRVRALNVSINGFTGTLHSILNHFSQYHSHCSYCKPTITPRGECHGLLSEASPKVNHGPKSASARARRQGTCVPGLFSKAPTTKNNPLMWRYA